MMIDAIKEFIERQKVDAVEHKEPLIYIPPRFMWDLYKAEFYNKLKKHESGYNYLDFGDLWIIEDQRMFTI